MGRPNYCRPLQRHSIVSRNAIWTARRKAIHEEIYQSPLSTFSFLNRYIEELDQVQKMNKVRVTRAPGVPAGPSAWCAPPPGTLKINVDAGVDTAGNRGTVVAVCRDEHGQYQGASALTILGVADPLILETLACREALALAEDLNAREIVVVSDCSSAILDIKSEATGETGAIIKELLSWRNRFNSCNFMYESRSTHADAHNLAKFSFGLAFGRHLWLGSVPPQAIIPVMIQV